MSLTAIGAPLLLTRLFHYFTAGGAPVYFPGAAFFTAGLMLLCAIGVFAWTHGGRAEAAPAA